jgi:hypothetical protein
LAAAAIAAAGLSSFSPAFRTGRGSAGRLAPAADRTLATELTLVPDTRRRLSCTGEPRPVPVPVVPVVVVVVVFRLSVLIVLAADVRRERVLPAVVPGPPAVPPELAVR